MNNEMEIVFTEEGVECGSEAEAKAVGINWRQKLSSRKLWAALLAALLAVVSAIFGEDLSPETADMLKTGIYGLVAYIFGEGVVDVARIVGDTFGQSNKADTAESSKTIR